MKRIAAAVVAAGAVAAIVVWLIIGRDPGAGPLAWPRDGGSSWSGFLPVNPGYVVAIGIPLVENEREPIVLLGVRPLPTDNAEGLNIRYAATTGRGLHIGGAGGWHPKAWQLHPLAGFVIPAHTPGGFMVGVSTRTRRRWFLHGFVVEYSMGGTQYSAPQYVGLKGRLARG